jgi:metal-dependent HD superfamily phosphatase/phosphodiesterase
MKHFAVKAFAVTLEKKIDPNFITNFVDNALGQIGAIVTLVGVLGMIGAAWRRQKHEMYSIMWEASLIAAFCGAGLWIFSSLGDIILKWVQD